MLPAALSASTFSNFPKPRWGLPTCEPRPMPSRGGDSPTPVSSSARSASRSRPAPGPASSAASPPATRVWSQRDERRRRPARRGGLDRLGRARRPLPDDRAHLRLRAPRAPGEPGAGAGVRIAPQTDLVVNIGDFDATRRRESLRRPASVAPTTWCGCARAKTQRSISGAWRHATIRTIKDAGASTGGTAPNAREPVGPEHSPRELAEQLLLGVEHGCVGHAAMRRVYLPSSPLAAYGQISELRLAQVTAVVALATVACPATKAIGVHEPNVLGLTSGANSLFAEAGANPRDTCADTSAHRGRDVAACECLTKPASTRSGDPRGARSAWPMRIARGEVHDDRTEKAH